MSGLGFGFSAIVWLIACLVAAGVVWRGRKGFVSGTSIALQRFRINEDPSARIALEISGRASGVVSWVLTVLKLEPEVELVVTDSEVTIRTASLSGIQHICIPLKGISATVCCYQRSILAFGFMILFCTGFLLNLLSGLSEGNRYAVGSDMGSAFGFLILAGAAALVYFLSKRISIGVETMHTHGVVFKRSLIENVSVDLPQALRAIEILNARILSARAEHVLAQKTAA